MNARRSPGRILSDHSKDQIANLLGNPLSTGDSSNRGDGAPIHGESGSVPAHHRLRANNDESLLPSCPESTRDNPKQLVQYPDRRARVTPLEDDELLPNCEILE